MCLGGPTSEPQAAYDLYLKAQQATVEKAKAGVTMNELEGTLHGILRDGGHAEHVFGPPLHDVGIDFEGPPLPAGPEVLTSFRRSLAAG